MCHGCMCLVAILQRKFGDTGTIAGTVAKSFGSSAMRSVGAVAGGVSAISGGIERLHSAAALPVHVLTWP